MLTCFLSRASPVKASKVLPSALPRGRWQWVEQAATTALRGDFQPPLGPSGTHFVPPVGLLQPTFAMLERYVFLLSLLTNTVTSVKNNTYSHYPYCTFQLSCAREGRRRIGLGREAPLSNLFLTSSVSWPFLQWWDSDVHPSPCEPSI